MKSQHSSLKNSKDTSRALFLNSRDKLSNTIVINHFIVCDSRL